jgi:hypothetical protein
LFENNWYNTYQRSEQNNTQRGNRWNQIILIILIFLIEIWLFLLNNSYHLRELRHFLYNLWIEVSLLLLRRTWDTVPTSIYFRCFPRLWYNQLHINFNLNKQNQHWHSICLVFYSEKRKQTFFISQITLSVHILSTSVNCVICRAIRNRFGSLACKFVATQSSRTKLIIAAYGTLSETRWIVWVTRNMLWRIVKKTAINKKRKRKYSEFIGLRSLIENRHVQRPWFPSPHCPYAVIFIFISCIRMQKHRQVA